MIVTCMLTSCPGRDNGNGKGEEWETARSSQNTGYGKHFQSQGQQQWIADCVYDLLSLQDLHLVQMQDQLIIMVSICSIVKTDLASFVVDVKD